MLYKSEDDEYYNIPGIVLGIDGMFNAMGLFRIKESGMPCRVPSDDVTKTKERFYYDVECNKNRCELSKEESI